MRSLRHSIQSILFGAVVAGHSSALAQPPEVPPGKAWKSGQILVQPRPGLDEEKLNRILERAGARGSKGKIAGIGVHIVAVPEHAEEAVRRALSHNPNIEFAELDEALELAAVPNDPRYGNAWHLPTVDAPTAWDFGRGEGVTIAILDTGVDSSHPDLSANMLPGWNSASNNNDSTDINGHGTKVAGTAAAVGDNGIGVAAPAWNASILPVRVTDSSDGWAYFSSIASGLTWAVDNGARVANISYNATGSSSISSAAQYMQSQGGLVVVAAGNDGNNPGYADSPYMISVAATNSSDATTSWSNFGDYIDVAAPGRSIQTTTNGGGYGSPSGTSFASPLTAGVVAVIKSVNPGLSPQQVEDVLEQSADDLGAAGFDQAYGHGRVNAGAAALLALETGGGDTVAPSAAITSPGVGATVSGQVAVDVSASDDQGVTKVELYADGALVASDTSAPYGFSWDTSQWSNGNVQLHAVAYDAAANEGSDAINVTVANSTPVYEDTTPPQVVLRNPADGSTVSGNVKIESSASDDQQISRVNVYVNDQLLCSTTSASVSCGWNTRKLAAGGYTIRAEAVDAAGNMAHDAHAVTVGSSGGGGSKGGNGGGKGRKK